MITASFLKWFYCDFVDVVVKYWIFFDIFSLFLLSFFFIYIWTKKKSNLLISFFKFFLFSLNDTNLIS